jgi:hypothetical protein
MNWIKYLNYLVVGIFKFLATMQANKPEWICQGKAQSRNPFRSSVSIFVREDRGHGPMRRLISTGVCMLIRFNPFLLSIRARFGWKQTSHRWLVFAPLSSHCVQVGNLDHHLQLSQMKQPALPWLHALASNPRLTCPPLPPPSSSRPC